MNIRKTATLAILPALLLAACGDDPAAETAKSGEVGELSGGTISDDMLPLAEVQSQSPTLKSEASSDGGAGAGSSNDPDTDSSEDSEASSDTDTDVASGADTGADNSEGED